MKFLVVFAATVSIGCLMSTPSYAQTASGDFKASANVPASCKIVEDGGWNLSENLDSLSLANNSISFGGNMHTLLCTKGSAATVVIKFDQGQNPQAESTCDAPLRQMKSSSGDLMSYELLVGKSPSYFESKILCRGVELPADPSGNYFYYQWTTSANVPAQSVKMGTYTDTVNITVEF